MTKLQDKAQAQVKQMVGQMIGDEKLVVEGKAQQKAAQESNSGESEEVGKQASEVDRKKSRRAQS